MSNKSNISSFTFRVDVPTWVTDFCFYDNQEIKVLKNTRICNVVANDIESARRKLEIRYPETYIKFMYEGLDR